MPQACCQFPDSHRGLSHSVQPHSIVICGGQGSSGTGSPYGLSVSLSVIFRITSYHKVMTKWPNRLQQRRARAVHISELHEGNCSQQQQSVTVTPPLSLRILCIRLFVHSRLITIGCQKFTVWHSTGRPSDVTDLASVRKWSWPNLK